MKKLLKVAQLVHDSRDSSSACVTLEQHSEWQCSMFKHTPRAWPSVHTIFIEPISYGPRGGVCMYMYVSSTSSVRGEVLGGSCGCNRNLH